jgi:apolipoprotein N-acyltransferase
MTAATLDTATRVAEPQVAEPKVGARAKSGARYMIFGAGALLWLFAVGGRWDLPFAAWLFPVFLLRFSRSTRPWPATVLVSIASVSAAMFWLWQLAIPLVPSSVGGSVAYGVLFAVPFVLDRLLWRRLPPIGGLLLFPAALAACEFLASVFSPLGASYGLLAVTQHANLPLLQLVSVAGPYSIGFLIGGFATTANMVWENAGSPRAVRRVVGVYGLVLIGVVGAGGLRLAFFPPASTYVRVAGITPSMGVLDAANAMLGKPTLGGTHPVSGADQAAIDPAKLAPAYNLVQTELLANTRSAAHAGAKIVVWSENAAVSRAEDETALLAKAIAVARQEHIYLDVAVNIPFVRDRTYLIAPDGGIRWTYDKSHPIPGMETYRPGSGRPAEAKTPWARLANVI